MRIAIPVFGNRISPRFDFAPHIRLFDTEGGEIIESKNVCCDGWGEVERVSRLKDMGINTLICGGLPNSQLELLTSGGIQVIPWVAGNADEALALFLEGRLKQRMVIRAERGKKKHCRARTKPPV
jgi:predicted Fe-Mo cluster-binding NifX family protein